MTARLYAIGPLTRDAFFEIDAIPDIRRQCAALPPGARQELLVGGAHIALRVASKFSALPKGAKV